MCSKDAEELELVDKLLEQIKLPECFDDWEDDDKLGCDDAEDFEYDEDE